MQVKTSITDPIRVDFVELERFGLKGRLGLTFAPGKFRMNGWTASWQRDLKTDLLRLKDHYGCQILVSLIEKFEFKKLKILTLRESAEEFGISSIWFPIVDGSIPDDPQNFTEIINGISNLLDDEKTVVVHCMGGLGRAGLTSACVLVSKGLMPAEAIKEVRSARPGAIETAEQEQFVHSFHHSLSNR
jgi:protein-tyrosine phosphatase